MTFPRSSLSFFLVASLTACGRLVDVPFDPGPPINATPSTTATAAALLLVAQDGDTLVVMSIDPATATARRFGPALPAVASHYAAAEVQASPDGLHAIVALSPSSPVGEAVPDDRPALALAGDGASWRVIASGGPLLDLGAVVSPDASTLWTARLCNATDYVGPAQHELLSFSGTSLWKDDTCRQSNTFSPVALARDGSLVAFVDASSVNVLTSATGKVSSVPTSSSASSVIATFPTSTVVAMNDRTVAWLDADGQALTVPGASTDAAAVVDPGHHITGPAGLYQVAGGALSVLHDRAVERIQSVPAGVGPNDVYGHLPGRYAIVGLPGGSLALVGTDGAVLTKRAAPPRDGRVGATGVSAHSFAGRWPWVVLTTNYLVPGTDIGDIDSVEELWLPGDPSTGVPAQSHALRSGTNLTSRSYFASADGEHALYLENGQLHCVDIATMADNIVRKDLVWYE